jgi:hypothetical protein
MAARKDLPKVEPLKKDLPEVEPVKRVKVLGNFRVVHDGTAYSGGDVAVVPEALAEEWLLNNWVTEASR